MNKSLTCLLTGLALIASPFPLSVSAQQRVEQKVKLQPKSAPTNAAKSLKVARLEFQKRYPAVKMLSAKAAKSPFAVVPRQVRFRPNKTVAKTPLKDEGALPTIYGVLAYGDFTPSGIEEDSLDAFYSFQPAAPFAYTQLSPASIYPVNSGVGIFGNKVIGINFDVDNWKTNNSIFASVVSLDKDTWQFTDEVADLEDYSLIALETAIDPTDGSVFGEFYNADLSAMEYGKVDYSQMTRTTVASTDKHMVAIGITSYGQAYGIASDGNLYKIDKATGAETLVGATGVTLETEDGDYYGQSGEIDPNTNTFYWAAIDADENSALYTVNLTTGEATQIGDDEAQIYSMIIPAAQSDEAAPAAVTGLSASFSGADSTGTITFTAPTTSTTGSTLSGGLTYTISANGNEVATGSTTPGATVNKEVTLPQGSNTIQVAVANSNGKSAEASTSVFVGYDTPEAPADVKLVFDNSHVATLSWSAPTKGMHNGFLGSLTYDVYRYTATDTVKVATAITATTFQETLPAASQIVNYVYGVQANNGGQLSPIAKSNGEAVGSAYDIPYFDRFPNAEDLNVYTIIDVNNDGHTWHFNSPNGGISYDFSWTQNADDWIITPSLNLKAGKTYNVSIWAHSYDSYYPEKIEAKWGQGTAVDNMTSDLIPQTVLADYTADPLTANIAPKADGTYNIGIHAISEANSYYLYVDSISVVMGADASAPDSVTNLKATPAANGDLNVELSFNAPAKALDGRALTAVDSIHIFKGDVQIGTIGHANAGEALSFVDNNAINGLNSYTLIPYNASGKGRSASIAVAAGVDKPTTPQLTATDNGSSVHLAWTASVAESGGVFNPAKVYYDIYSLTDDGFIGDSITSLQNAFEYDLPFNTNEGEQRNAGWAVHARNTAGVSGFSNAHILVGAPYSMPLHESFAGGATGSKFVGMANGNDGIYWGIATDMSVDNDGGSAYFTATRTQGDATLYSGKVSLLGTINPELIFSYWGRANGHANLFVEAQHQDGRIDSLWSIKLDTVPSRSQGWHKVTLPLTPSDDYVVVRFRAVPTGGNYYIPLYVDDIHLADPLTSDATIDVSATKSVKKGQNVSIQATLTNNGYEPLRNPEVKIYVNNKVIADTTLHKTLNTFDQTVIPFTYRTSTAYDAGNSITVKAEAVNTYDLNDEDNTATCSVQFAENDLPAPNGLNGNAVEDGVSLSWGTPASSAKTVTETFESYTPWLTEGVGDWTFINVNNGHFGSVLDGSEPNAYKPAAYEVWRPSDYFAGQQGVDPHNGQQCLASIYKLTEDGSHYEFADDWLVSPLLSEKEQTIKFWVNNLNIQGQEEFETYQVFYSTTGKQVADFVAADTLCTQADGQWTEKSVLIPAGSKYFAIRRGTDYKTQSIFFVDDITYEAGPALKGFNVYRDGVLIGTTTDNSFTDQASAVGNHTFSVAAVYSDGSESEAVTTSVVVTSIDAIADMLHADSFDVYTVGGAAVRLNAKSLSGLKPGVYVINGVMTLIK